MFSKRANMWAKKKIQNNDLNVARFFACVIWMRESTIYMSFCICCILFCTFPWVLLETCWVFWGLASQIFLVALFVCIYPFLCFLGYIFSSFDVSRTSSTAYHIKSLLPMIYGEIRHDLSVYIGPELVISEYLHDGCRRESNWSLTLALGWPLIWTFQTAKFDCDWMGFRVVFISFQSDVLHERHRCRSQHWSSSSLPIATKSSIRRCSQQSSVGQLKAKYIISRLWYMTIYLLICT